METATGRLQQGDCNIETEMWNISVATLYVYGCEIWLKM